MCCNFVLFIVRFLTIVVRNSDMSLIVKNLFYPEEFLGIPVLLLPRRPRNPNKAMDASIVSDLCLVKSTMTERKRAAGTVPRFKHKITVEPVLSGQPRGIAK